MMAKYTADVRLNITVTFEDDGRASLVDQAMDAVWGYKLDTYTADAEILQRSIREVKP